MHRQVRSSIQFDLLARGFKPEASSHFESVPIGVLLERFRRGCSDPGETDKPCILDVSSDSNDIYVPVYQRDFSIWGSEAQSALIRSIMTGVTIPPIQLVQRRLPDGKFSYALRDGLQRLSAVKAFVDNEFGVTDPFDENANVTVFFSKATGPAGQSQALTEASRAAFTQCPFSVEIITRDLSEDQERQHFMAIQSVAPQTVAERIHALGSDPRNNFWCSVVQLAFELNEAGLLDELIDCNGPQGEPRTEMRGETTRYYSFVAQIATNFALVAKGDFFTLCPRHKLMDHNTLFVLEKDCEHLAGTLSRVSLWLKPHLLEFCQAIRSVSRDRLAPERFMEILWEHSSQKLGLAGVDAAKLKECLKRGDLIAEIRRCPEKIKEALQAFKATYVGRARADRPGAAADLWLMQLRTICARGLAPDAEKRMTLLVNNFAEDCGYHADLSTVPRGKSAERMVKRLQEALD